MHANLLGVGLRSEHYLEVLEQKPKLEWFEVHSENYFDFFSRDFEVLFELSKNYRISFHGIGLSLGSGDGLDKAHLQRIKRLCDEIPPIMISEHISWSRIDGRYVPDLLPIPYNSSSLTIMADNIKHAQDYLGRQLLVENPSSYLSYKTSTMSEVDFINEISYKAQCGILLDVNNVYVSANNHHFSARDYLCSVNASAVGELHLAGHAQDATPGSRLLIDTHDTSVSDDVMELYRLTIEHFGPRPTILEWDANLPTLNELLLEASKIKAVLGEQYECAA